MKLTTSVSLHHWRVYCWATEQWQLIGVDRPVSKGFSPKQHRASLHVCGSNWLDQTVTANNHLTHQMECFTHPSVVTSTKQLNGWKSRDALRRNLDCDWMSALRLRSNGTNQVISPPLVAARFYSQWVHEIFLLKWCWLVWSYFKRLETYQMGAFQDGAV